MDFNVVAHDLRAPLNMMLPYLQLLAFEPLSADGRTRLTVLEEQVRRMMRLLDRYTGVLPHVTSLAPVDVGVTIRNVMSELDALLERRGIQLRSTIDDDLPPVHGDGDLLHRALLNVLTNAIEAMPDAGVIAIATHCVPGASSGSLRIEIADTGGGIASELVSRVFEHGFTTKADTERHGLGLSICREIVQMHGGQIELSSVPGQGTTVSLTLPTDQDHWTETTWHMRRNLATVSPHQT